MQITEEVTKDHQQLVMKHIWLYELFKKWDLSLKEYKEKKILISNVII